MGTGEDKPQVLGGGAVATGPRVDGLVLQSTSRFRLRRHSDTWPGASCVVAGRRFSRPAPKLLRRSAHMHLPLARPLAGVGPCLKLCARPSTTGGGRRSLAGEGIKVRVPHFRRVAHALVWCILRGRVACASVREGVLLSGGVLLFSRRVSFLYLGIVYMCVCVCVCVWMGE